MKINNKKMMTKSQVDTSSNKYNNSTVSSSSRSSSSAADNNRLENVLILQGGGSLGAFGCGVFKALANNNIKVDIVAGTSIGGINAAIIAGSKNEKHPEEALERFWLELSEGFVDLDRGATFPSSSSLPKFVEEMLSFYSSAVFGNDKMFKPRWRKGNILTDPEYFVSQKWTYMYDLSPLVKTLEKYIDYDKLRPNGNPNARLILTAVNILTAEPLTFDSYRCQMQR
jgi:NTE family protein